MCAMYSSMHMLCTASIDTYAERRTRHPSPLPDCRHAHVQRKNCPVQNFQLPELISGNLSMGERVTQGESYSSSEYPHSLLQWMDTLRGTLLGG